jgi:hypothetical protein
MQHAAFGVHLVKLHPASFRHPEAMPDHQAAVAGLVPAALRRLDQPFNLAAG